MLKINCIKKFNESHKKKKKWKSAGAVPNKNITGWTVDVSVKVSVKAFCKKSLKI